MWYATVLSAIIILAILIDEDILRIEKRMYWSSETMRIILLVGKYELAYWHSNNTGYRAFVFCLWRLHISYCSYRHYLDDDSEKPKLTAYAQLIGGRVFAEDWVYELFRFGVGVTRIRGIVVEFVDSTTWSQEGNLESTVNVKQLHFRKATGHVSEE